MKYILLILLFICKNLFAQCPSVLNGNHNNIVRIYNVLGQDVNINTPSIIFILYTNGQIKKYFNI